MGSDKWGYEYYRAIILITQIRGLFTPLIITIPMNLQEDFIENLRG